MGEENSLTQPPKDLKEAIDWLALVGEYGENGWDISKRNKLDESIKSDHDWAQAKQKAGIINIQGVVNNLAKMLGSRFLGYSSQKSNDFTGDEGIVKDGGNYQSSYIHFEWQENHIHDYLKITLCAASMMFYGLSFLYWKCKVSHGDGWSNSQLNDDGGWGLGRFMRDMGFNPSRELRDVKGSKVATILDSEGAHNFDELQKAYGNGQYVYSNFVDELETQYNPQNNALNSPLTSCYKFAKHYFTSKFKERDSESIDQTLTAIKKSLEGFSKLCTTSAQDLQYRVGGFLKEVGASKSTTMPEPKTDAAPSDNPSPTGPVAGTLTTLGLGGGAAAAYLLDLGGAKTLLRHNVLTSHPYIHTYPPQSISLFDSSSNLKEAIDWILRVTGKDGQNKSSQDGTSDLAKEVQRLLEEVEKSGTEYSEDIKKVIGALGNGLIGNLADGLRQFIGYDATSKGTPIITGGGILPANVAKHQVCNAVLNFVIRFLEGLCEIKASGHEKVLVVIGKLRKFVGTGKVPQGFKELVGKIEEKVDDLNGLQGNAGRGLKEVFGNLKTVVSTASLDSGGSESVQSFKTHVDSFLGEAFGMVKGEDPRTHLSNFNNVCTQLISLFNQRNIKNGLTTTNPLNNTLNTHIQKVSRAANNAALNGEINGSRTGKPFTAALLSTLQSAANSVVGDLTTKPYTSYYYDTPQKQWSDNTQINGNHAKIFLGYLPLYYQALTYIYWGCHDKGGPWRNLTLANGSMRSYFDSQGFLPTFVESNRTGAHIADSALKGFSELQAAASSFNDSKYPYVSFTKNLREKVNGFTSAYTTCPLSALFYGASCYFQCQHITNAKSAGGTPRTIREMLYFLAALQFSPQYDAFDGYVTEYFKGLQPDLKNKNDDSDLKLHVAISGSSKTGDTLSAADLKSYLTSTFHLAPAFIGLIQEPSRFGEPWLHSLYCNSMNLQYPSGSALFNTLSNYAYALQFQLYFLYIQCANNYTYTCGWNQCAFGANVNASIQGRIVVSYICPTGCTTSGGGHDHSTRPDQCEHTGCGSNGKGSPLQAFLTDKLKGFSRGHPSHPSSHLATCSGYMCHVPMGFENALRETPNAGYQGSHISLTLKPFCGSSSTPLSQLSEKLSCLTKRAPSTLGGIFGFIWHLNGQLFKNKSPTLGDLIEKFDKAFDLGNNLKQTFSNDSYIALTLLWNRISKLKFQKPQSQNATVLSRSLEAMAPQIPFLYQLFMARDAESLPVVLFDLKQQCHKVEVQTDGGTHRTTTTVTHNGSAEHNCSSTPADLFSLQTSRCTKGPNCGPYLSPLTHTHGSAFAPIHASSYLSWVIYLAEDLHSRFQEMHDDLKNITCIPSSGSHGPSGSCSCPSVVECAEVLPILYANGFTFASAGLLKNGGGQPSGKKSCQNFHDQLSAVLANDENTPLFKLLTVIDDFLYMFRFYFFYNLSTFWSIYVCIILYTFFFLLDTLRVRSHLHFPSSHSISTISLLGTGKAPALKKLTYYMP
ncbi:extracellular matrix-binding ebh [Babesia caballi]|uniref:Extracellular matrix-binding ebh n=1 Tax=Babesia caballi TaxID=5871 RepID=A0AAV4LU62_BABCB|nr:extracellular matrix-binding ebh [Babesia caballi]